MMSDKAAPRVILLLGSNADAQANLTAAVAAISLQFPVIAVSARHQSPPANLADAEPYWNQAVLVMSSLAREPMKLHLRAIEESLGRIRPALDARICPIDIDALAQVDGELAVWDRKTMDTDYAQAPLADLRGHW